MTAITLNSALALQPPPPSGPEAAAATIVRALPSTNTSNASRDTGTSSDQSGQGAGNGTGTGGAQIAGMLKKARGDMSSSDATRRSVVEAQSDADPATRFLARKARQRMEAEAAAEQRAADVEMARAEAARAEAARAARKAAMPDPLPTAPILQESA